ncbi:uncharacterized protein SAPINGB_P004780 [Magnusiomyces paraingens]|uniref:t-SNARE coiled-coil homology domain-containing protein n=1 Tax=Magnusiomyces paraingens TaxID=2606893 RepID=A0A5E8BWL0_9ASCO|nr:uncharacterized protein SAPINGB_P004780 [Saprochaete ingens]VVT55872.1 unnamed protein product [Saprochaete ingens]
MFRDRTNLYISYRQSYAHHPRFSTGVSGSAFDVPEEQQFLMTHNNDSEVDGPTEAIAIEMDTLPPAWLDVSEEVDEFLSKIKTKMAKLQVLYKKNSLPGFDDRAAEEKEIEQLTYEVTSELHQCQSLIKKFDQMSNASANTSSEISMAKNMKISMASKVQASSTEFRKMQSNYLKSLRTEAATENTNSNTTNSQYLPEEEDEFDNSLAQSQLTQTQQFSQEHDTQQREREIMKIAQGILELSAIFKDLQTMVIDQGTILDRIDYNIETMHTNVKAADKELVTATHYQKRTQKCKIILLLLLIVLGLFILLLAKPKHHYSTSPPKEERPPSPSTGA